VKRSKNTMRPSPVVLVRLASKPERDPQREAQSRPSIEMLRRNSCTVILPSTAFLPKYTCEWLGELKMNTPIIDSATLMGSRFLL